jgi:hypothetical protein
MKVTVEHIHKRRRRKDMLKKFGIHFDQFEIMLKEQNYVCAICKKAETCNRSLAIDHNHSTKKIRGLLCTNCNTAIGKFQDNIDNLRSAIEYLEQDYVVPEVNDSYIFVNHNDRPNWKSLVTTPDGQFPSLKHAGDYYQVNHTTIRSWCMPNSKWKKEGFSCMKVFKSLNELKEELIVKT